MEMYNFDAYIVPLDEQGRREWISGFTGSNGDCIVTKDKVFVYVILMLVYDTKKHVYLNLIITHLRPLYGQMEGIL